MVIRIVHPGRHRKEQASRTIAERVRQRAKISIRVPVCPVPRELHDLLAQVDLADGVIASLVCEGTTRQWFGQERSGRWQREAQTETQSYKQTSPPGSILESTIIPIMTRPFGPTTPT